MADNHVVHVAHHVYQLHCGAQRTFGESAQQLFHHQPRRYITAAMAACAVGQHAIQLVCRLPVAAGILVVVASAAVRDDVNFHC